MTPEKLDELERQFNAVRNKSFEGHDSSLGHLFWLNADDLIAAARREAALREAIEALPTNHINWHDAEGEHDEHCHVVKVTDVLALLSEVPQ